MKKWLALLLISLVGVGTLYADTLKIYVGNNNEPYTVPLGSSVKVTYEFGSNGKIIVKYDNGTKVIGINGTYNGQLTINITNGSNDVVFSITIGINENMSIIIKKTNNGWVMIIPTKAPIPPIAIALTLMAIPIIALRKLKIAK